MSAIYKLACYVDTQAVYGVRFLDRVPLAGTVLNIGVLFVKSISYLLSFITEVHFRSDLLHYLDGRTVKECIYLLDPFWGRRAVIADRKTSKNFDRAAIKNSPGCAGLAIFANMDQPLNDDLKEKIKNKKSTSKQDSVIREMAFQGIISPSFTQMLLSKLEEAKNFIDSEKKIWQLATYHLFESSSFDDSDCNRRLHWKNCEAWAFDSFSCKLKTGNEVWREDALNDQECHVKALKLKDKMLKLSEKKKQNLCMTITAANDQEKPQYNIKVQNVYEKITKISSLLEKKYSKNISFENHEFVYKKSVSDIVFDLLKKIVPIQAVDYKSNKKLVDALYEEEFSNQVCKEVVIKLLSKAKIKNDTLYFGDGQILNFGKIEGKPKDYDDVKHIALFKVNELTSKNHVEELFVDDHALVLAKSCEELRNPNLDPQLSQKLDSFSLWIKKNFYFPFCASFSNKLKELSPLKDTQKIEKNSKSKKKKKDIEISTTNISKRTSRRVDNDNKGEAKIFMKYLEKKFKIEKDGSWCKAGSCFLSCFIPKHKGEDEYQGIRKARQEISEMLEKNMESYIDLVEVVPGFNTMAKIKKTRLLNDTWVVCEEVICDKNASTRKKLLAEEQQRELKEKAILSRCEEIKKIENYLVGCEFELYAQVLKKAIYVYKRKVDTFFVNEFEEPLPVAIYGKAYDGKTRCHLIDDYDHYRPLTPI